MNPFMSMNPFPQTSDQGQPSQSQEQQLMQMLKSNPQLMKKYQQQMAKFTHQNKKGTKVNRSPLTSKQYMQKVSAKQIQQYIDQQGGLIIQPEAGFVLKFYEKRSNQKMFINIVKHEVIDHPEQKVLLDLDSQSGLRIPMSMGRVKDETDKGGKPCKVVDVVLNPKIVETAETTPDILIFMAQIVANYLLEKYKITVSDEQMKKVKGLKYKGTSIQMQRVKGKKNPKIEQVSEQNNSKQYLDKEQQLFNKINNQNQAKKAITPQFKVFIIDQNGTKESYSYDSNLKTVQKVQILIDVSHLIHSKGIHLQASERLVFLQVRNIYELCLKMPISIAKWNGVFSRKDRKLLIIGQPKQKMEEIKRLKGLSEAVATSVKSQQKQKIEIQMENDLLYDIV